MHERLVKIALLGTIFFVRVALAATGAAPEAVASRLPGIGPADHRHPVALDAEPFRALARVQTELGARCTGFLIAPTLVMTAAHCLFLPRVGRYVQPESVHVLLGYRAGAFRAHARIVAFRIASGYRFTNEAATAGADRAVLVLDRPVGVPGDVLALAPPPVRGAAPHPVVLAGYGQDRNELAVVSPACSVSASPGDGEGRILLAHDCQATSGTSGAPLAERCADGHWAAIGVQIEARMGEAGGLAVPTLDPAPGAAIPPGRCADR